MTQPTKRIKDLQQGDIVQSDSGNLVVQSVTKEGIFDGDVWRVTVAGGKTAGLYNGCDKVAVADNPNGDVS